MESIALLQTELNQYIDFHNITNEDIYENKFFNKIFNETFKNHTGIAYIQSGGGIGNAFLSAFIGIYIAYKLKKVPMITSHTMNCGNLEFTEVFDFNENMIYGVNLHTEKVCNYLRVPKDIWDNGSSDNPFWIGSQCDVKGRFKKIKKHNDKMNALYPYEDCNIYLGGNGWPLNVEFNVLKEAIEYYGIKLKKDIIDKSIKFIEKNNITDKTLGLHWRGTDSWWIDSYDKKCYPGGWFSLDHFLLEGEKQLKYFNRGFVCSEDKEAEEKILEKLKGTIRYDKNHYTEKTGDKWKVWKGKGNDHVYNVNRTKNACKEAMVDCIVLGKTYCMQRHDWPPCTINKKWAGSSFVQFGLFLHKFMKGLHKLDIVEKGPIIRVKGLNQPKPKADAKIQTRLIENENRRKEIKEQQKKKKDALIKYTMNKAEKQRKKNKIIKLDEVGKRTPINLQTAKILKKSKVERTRLRLKMLREAAKIARETNNTENNFKIN